MTILTNKKDIDNYLSRIDNQKDVLLFSPIFSENDKVAIRKIYDQLHEICSKNKARYIDVKEAQDL